MADVAYCPRCGVACLADEDIALCSKCVFHFCPRCSDPPHIGRECIVPTPEEKLLTLQERSKVYIESRKRINLANEIRSIREVLRSCVPCPHCGIAISRVSGCDHMVCRSCGNPFNYAYRRPENERAVDFIKVESVPIEQRRVLSLSVSSRQYPCPKCHRPYPKMGNNNHIWCLACQVHYCALCRKVVRKISEHYGPRGCKQHTVDPEILKTKNKDDSGSELL